MHDEFLSVLWVKFENGLRYFRVIHISLKQCAVKSNSWWVVSALSRDNRRLLQDRAYRSWKSSGWGERGIRKLVWSVYKLIEELKHCVLFHVCSWELIWIKKKKKKKATDFLILTSLFCLSSGIQMKTTGSPAAQHTNTYTPTWATS